MEAAREGVVPSSPAGRDDRSHSGSGTPCTVPCPWLPKQDPKWEHSNQQASGHSRHRCHFQTSLSWPHHDSPGSQGWDNLRTGLWTLADPPWKCSQPGNTELRTLDLAKALEITHSSSYGDKTEALRGEQDHPGHWWSSRTGSPASLTTRSGPALCTASCPGQSLCVYVVIAVYRALRSGLALGTAALQEKLGDVADLGLSSLPEPGGQIWKLSVEPRVRPLKRIFSQSSTPGISNTVAEVTAWSQGSAIPSN